MIRRVRLLHNVGVFGKTSIPHKFKPIVLIYAENGGGKTTLAEIFRSLETGDATAILKKHRFATKDGPYIVLECDGEPSTVIFENDSWNSNSLHVKVFDEFFINNNVYSGLDVGSEHRKNLHDFVLGEQGVALSRRKRDIGHEIRKYNHLIKEATDAVPNEQRRGLSMDEFCALPKVSNVKNKMMNAVGTINALEHPNAIQQMSEFAKIHLPCFDNAAINHLLQQNLHDLNKDTATKVKKHIESLGGDGESWIARGMKYISKDAKKCPFCGQNALGLSLIEHYRAYFSEAYENLKNDIDNMLDEVRNAHSDAVQARFERTVEANKDLEHFWMQYRNVPLPNINTNAIIKDWTSTLNAVTKLLEKKQAAPLEKIRWGEDTLSPHELHANQIADVNRILGTYNDKIKKLKYAVNTSTMRSVTNNLTQLSATRERFSPSVATWCSQYIEARDAKIRANEKKEQVTRRLNAHREETFPALQDEMNQCLLDLGARFTIQGLNPTNIASGASCEYSVNIDNTSIGTNKPKLPTDPSIGETLSSGDRSTLALAFFFSSLIMEKNLDDVIVVMDDPVSSMDDHRSLATIQTLRKLSRKVGQLIILSHRQSFLYEVLRKVGRPEYLSLAIVHTDKGSTVQKWNVNRAPNAEQSRLQRLLEKYGKDETGNPQDVAEAIRPFIEAFLEVSCAGHYTSGRQIGNFLGECEQKFGTDDEILSKEVTAELRDIVEYANKFKHYQSGVVNGSVNRAELSIYVRKTLNVTKPTISKTL